MGLDLIGLYVVFSEAAYVEAPFLPRMEEV
jgi:hypothetical protein